MNPLLVNALLATNRPAMCDAARRRFTLQTYGNSILQVDNKEGTHGAKMDRLFKVAFGHLAVVVDDDDEYAPDRIEKLVAAMAANPKINAVGTGLIYYVDERIGKAWLYDNAVMPKSSFWIGAPMYRTKAYIDYGPWPDLKCGADLHFLRKLPRETVLDLRDPNLMVCRIHDANAAGKDPVGPCWTEVPIASLPAFYHKGAPPADAAWAKARMRGGEEL